MHSELFHLILNDQLQPRKLIYKGLLWFVRDAKLKFYGVKELPQVIPSTIQLSQDAG